MSRETSLVLPMQHIPDIALDTKQGTMLLPGQSISKKEIAVDPKVVADCLAAARQQAADAYAPYSEFKVGAAVVMADDPAQQIRTGANVENSSFGLTVCAERACLSAAVSDGFRTIRYLAVSTVGTLNQSLPERMPCGACRQTIQEFSGGLGLQNETLVLIDSAAPNILCEFFDMPRLMAYGFCLDKSEGQ